MFDNDVTYATEELRELDEVRKKKEEVTQRFKWEVNRVKQVKAKRTEALKEWRARKPSQEEWRKSRPAISASDLEAFERLNRARKALEEVKLEFKEALRVAQESVQEQ